MEKMKFESKDMREELILQMEKIMPGCIAEGRNADGSIEKKVDLEKLKLLLGGCVLEGEERYEFSWVGKKEYIPDANRPVRKTLRPVKESCELLYLELFNSGWNPA